MGGTRIYSPIRMPSHACLPCLQNICCNRTYSVHEQWLDYCRKPMAKSIDTKVTRDTQARTAIINRTSVVVVAFAHALIHVYLSIPK